MQLTEENLKRTLKSLPEGERLILVPRDRDVQKNLKLNAQNRGENLIKSLEIATLSDYSVVIDLEDAVINPILKEFLETRQFIVYNSTYITRLFLACNIKVNIVDDALLMVYCRYPKEGMISLKTLSSLDINLPTSKGYIDCFRYIIKTYQPEAQSPDYQSLLKVSNLLAYSQYFNIYIDEDVELKRERVQEKTAKLLILLADFKEKYGVDIQTNRAKIAYRHQEWGVTFSIRDLRLLAEDNLKAKSMLEIITLEREISRINPRIFVGNPLIRNFKIANRYATLTYLPTKDLNIFHTNPKKHYYLRIYAPNMGFRYLDKVCFNQTSPIGVDYYANLASQIYAVPLNQVTKDQYDSARRYTICRFHKSVPNGFPSVVARMHSLLGEEIHIFKEKTPLWTNVNLSNLDKIVLRSLEKVQSMLQDKGYLTKVSLFYGDDSEFVFRVSNKVNPYELMLLLSEAFDTTKELDFKLFDSFYLANELGTLLNNHVYTFEEGESQYTLQEMTTDFATELFRKDKTRKFRNIVHEVKTDFESYKK